MKNQFTLIILSTFSLLSCEFNKSASLDLLAGLSTQGDGLSCDDVSISDGAQKLSLNTFTYGEMFYMDFENIEGFKKDEDYAFPGMRLSVLNKAGDTLLANNDLYSNFEDGINLSPLLLRAKITAAEPLHSNNDYKLHINIWDKKGEGTFKAELDFEVIPNDKIRIESKGVSYDEIYLFSQEGKTTITNNMVKINENIFMIFEGLQGFVIEEDRVYPGLSILAEDAEGSVLLNEKDLVGESGMEAAQFYEQVAPNIIFTGSDITNPVTCKIVIWDKKSELRIETSTELTLE